MKKITLILAFLLGTSWLSAQEQYYYDDKYAAEKFLTAKDYKAAKLQYEKLFKQHEESSNNDYYNGACAAALLGDKNLAISWLNKSIEMGFIDIKYLEQDIDFQSLRKNKDWIKATQKCKKNWQDLCEMLKPIAAQNEGFEKLIPFSKANKNGYMSVGSNTVVVAAVFGYTSFYNNRNTPELSYYGQKIHLDKTNGLRLYQEEKTEGDYGVMADISGSEERVFKPKNDKEGLGFVEQFGTITSYSKDYQSIEQFTLGGKIYGIAEKDKYFGLITEDGSFVFENIGFDFLSIKYDENNTLFSVQRADNNLWEVLNLKGKKVIENSESQPQMINQQYFSVMRQGKWGVLNFSNQTILDFNYDNIVYCLEASYRSVIPTLFLVKRGEDDFYVDINKIEYTPK